MQALLLQSLNKQSLHTYTSLLAVPTVAKLASLPEDDNLRAIYELVRIFSHGTYADYEEWKVKAKVGGLAPSGILKLRMLSMVSLCSESTSFTLSFLDLGKKLGIDISASTRELEDVIVTSIYSGLLMGKIYHHPSHPGGGIFKVSKVLYGRDTPSSALPDLIIKLEGLQERLNTEIIEGLKVVRQDVLAKREKSAEVMQKLAKKVSHFDELAAKGKVDADTDIWEGSGSAGRKAAGHKRNRVAEK